MTDDARPVLRLRGEVDMLNAEAVRAEGSRLLAGAGAGASLTVDLGDVTFLDSAGLSALIQLRHLATADGGEVLLRSVPDRVAALLRVSGLTDVFPSV
jgi:anti-sigma B factor antagonist